MKVFVGIELPEEVRHALTRVGAKISPCLGKSGRLTACADLHLTVRFIGFADETTVARLLDAVRRETAVCAKPRLALSSIGCFPDHGPIRIVWAGLCGDIDRLAVIAAGVERGVAEVGFPEDARELLPHVTLARVTPPIVRPAARAQLALVALPPILFCAEHLTLFESLPKPSPNRYQARERIALRD